MINIIMLPKPYINVSLTFQSNLIEPPLFLFFQDLIYTSIYPCTINPLPSPRHIICSSSTIQYSSHIRDLGVLFDHSLLFDIHKSHLIKTINFYLHSPFIQKSDVTFIIASSYIVAHLDYCNSPPLLSLPNYLINCEHYKFAWPGVFSHSRCPCNTPSHRTPLAPPLKIASFIKHCR